MLAHRSSRIVAYVQTQKIKDFLLTTASRYTLNFYRNNGAIGIYPKSNRVGQVVDPNSFDFDDNIKEL
ncbi:hypothetical protein KBB05_03490 [Patescibacteria group bacterium]|nr:hypothetical protein [Patescibacteria group bacterium]